MRNGSGDEYSIVFLADGVFVRGFDHESDMSPTKLAPKSLWPGLVDGIPDSFMSFVNEPAFADTSGTPLMTICLWRLTDDETWHYGTASYPRSGTGADGSEWLFTQLLDSSPQGYVDFASEYYEAALELSDVAAILRAEPLTRELASRMNPERNWSELLEEIEEIGYPVER
jgi:hypothetical protein